MTKVPEESKDKYGVFNDDLPQINDWDKACAIAAEIERKNGHTETEEERLERIARAGLSDVLGLLSQYR